jgi:hypothetical protein
VNTDETKEILRLICAAYPTQRQRMTGADLHAMLAVWSLGLADVEMEPAVRAVGRIVCTSKFLPSLAEFRAALGDVHHGARRTGAEAWGDIRKLFAYRERSAMADVDPVVLEVCTAQGWIHWRTMWRNGKDIEQWHVAMGEDANPAADRARFIELYDVLTVGERKAAQLAPGGKIPERLAAPEGRQLGAIVKAMLPAGDES